MIDSAGIDTTKAVSLEMEMVVLLVYSLHGNNYTSLAIRHRDDCECEFFLPVMPSSLSLSPHHVEVNPDYVYAV